MKSFWTIRPTLPRARWRRHARIALLAGGSIALTTCADAPTAPNRIGFGTVAIRPVFRNGTSFAGLILDNARIIVVRPPVDTVAVVSGLFPAGSPQLQLTAPVQLKSASENLLVTLELYGGSVLLFTGTQTLSVSAGVGNPPAPIPVAYQGPGAQIAAVTLAPRDTTVTAGTSFLFRVTAADSQAQGVTQFYVSWNANPAVAGQTIDGAGAFTAAALRGSTYIKASTPGGVVDSTQVFVIPVANQLVKTGGDAQTALQGIALPLPLTVQARAADNLGVPGVVVTFAAATGGGSVIASSDTTDSLGFASTGVTLGAKVGAQTFTATSSAGVATFNETATATVLPASQLAVSVQPSATASSGAVLAQQPAIQVEDVNGAAVNTAGIVVTAAIASGGGTLGGTAIATTATSGLATFTNLAITGTPGPRTLSFTSSGLTTATSGTVTIGSGPAASIAVNAGNAQTATTGSAVAIPPSVIVLDANANPVGGVAVTFAVGGGAGSVTGANATTNASGIATVGSWTLGATPGPNSLLATSTGLTGSPVTFTATGTTAGALITWNGTTSTNWSTAANWTPAQVPTVPSDVVIPAGAPNQPTLTTTSSIHDLTIASGATLTISGSLGFTVNGNLDATGNLTTAGGVALQLVGTSKVLRGNLAGGTITGSYTLNGPTNILGGINLDIVGATASLTLNGNKLTTAGAFTTASSGVLKMQNNLDTMLVAGAGIFSGGSETGLLTAGFLSIGGSFAQNGSTTSFVASGTHTTRLGSAAVKIVTFANPATSFFQNLDVTPALGGLTLNSPVIIQGSLIAHPAGLPPLIGSTNRVLQVGGLDVTGLTFDNTLLLMNGGTFTQFSNVLFQNYATSAQVIQINHPGTAAHFVFNNVDFALVPSGGLYLKATDTSPGAPVLTIDMVNPTPGTDGGRSLSVGGAVINWPATPLFTWTGSVSTNWSSSGNWNAGRVPNATDSVIIPNIGNHPTLTADAVVGAVTVTGGSLTLGGHTLTTSTGFYTTGTGTLTMNNPADSLQVSGPAVFDGGDETGNLTDGRLLVAGNLTQRHTTSLSSFLATGNHHVVLNGTGAQVLNFADSISAFFANLDDNNVSALVQLSTAINVQGNFSMLPGSHLTGLDNTRLGTEFIVFGDISAPSTSTLAMGQLFCGGTLSIQGVYSVAAMIFIGTSGQIIPANLPYQYLDVTGDATFGTGRPVINQDVILTGTQLKLTDSTVIHGSIFITAGTLALNGQTLSIDGGLSTGGTGLVQMTNAADKLVIAGAASFGGGDETGLLSAGTMFLGGDFTEFGAGAPLAFATSGTHRTVLNGTAGQNINFNAPGKASSHFQDLEIQNTTAPITLQTSVFVNGQLIMLNTPINYTIQSLGQVLTVGGTNISAGTGEAIFDSTQVVISATGGAIASFSKVHFINMSPTVDQLTVSHPGIAGVQIGLGGVEFDTTPTIGSYLSAIDSDGIGPALNILITHLVNPLPAQGNTFTKKTGGALVTWQ